MMYGNYYEGYGYSPDRSRDVDRFNPSTRANYAINDVSFAAACGSAMNNNRCVGNSYAETKQEGRWVRLGSGKMVWEG